MATCNSVLVLHQFYLLKTGACSELCSWQLTVTVDWLCYNMDRTLLFPFFFLSYHLRQVTYFWTDWLAHQRLKMMTCLWNLPFSTCPEIEKLLYPHSFFLLSALSCPCGSSFLIVSAISLTAHFFPTMLLSSANPRSLLCALSLPVSLLLFIPVSCTPHNNRIASCGTAGVPARWMKLSWFPWGSKKGRETLTCTPSPLFTISYHYIESRGDQRPRAAQSHTHAYTLSHSAHRGSSPSSLYPSWAVIQSRGGGGQLSQDLPTGSVSRTLDSHSGHTEAALFSQRDWRCKRWLPLLTCNSLGRGVSAFFFFLKGLLKDAWNFVVFQVFCDHTTCYAEVKMLVWAPSNPCGHADRINAQYLCLQLWKCGNWK